MNKIINDRYKSLVKPIITSLLDTDLYKFTMMQTVLHQFPEVMVEYEFKLRNYTVGTLDRYKNEIDVQLDLLCDLRFEESELEYLSSLLFFKPDFIEFLRLFKLNRDHIETWICDESDNIFEKGEFRITIKGPWLMTILFEVPVLAIVSELFCTYDMSDDVFGNKRELMKFAEEANTRLKQKIEFIGDKFKWPGFPSGYIPSDIKIADFGTRRRASRFWHQNVVGELVEKLPDNFVGTSNVWLAKHYGIKPIGTMAHEYIQAMQGMKNCRLSESQKMAFQTWADEYRGDLGIALSDCLGMDAFFRDFDKYFSKLFDGTRHDSGDPYEWCDKLIAHYESMGIDPKTKTAVFSDGLDFVKAWDLFDHYNGKIKTAFGIGTNITNDSGFIAPQIVIKMTKCNGSPVAKISDSPGKAMCADAEYLKYLSSVFGIGDTK